MSSPSSSLDLDASDPLNLLLQNNSSDSDSAGSPPDWSEFSTLWQTLDRPEDSKFNSENGEVDFSTMTMDSMMTEMGMNIDDLYNPAASIEPSALYYNYTHEGNSKEITSMTASTTAISFPFTLQDQQYMTHKRKLSIGSTFSSSASSISLSPVIEVAKQFDVKMFDQPPSVLPLQKAADQLAQRVRESAGVMRAVPMDIQRSSTVPNNPVQPQNAKLPIPRLAPSKRAFSSPSSTAPTPPSLEDSPSPIALFSGGPPLLSASASGRPKTSHTTIERRYRTNLNARIQSLRMAVPALRVLEKSKAGGQYAENENAENTSSSFGDVIDERGFVDGVKVARKCSKANVLGKAVEYIRVLKNRENRLKHEQSGLKSLVSGLVGGPALLREWETEWTNRFGGPERDEDIGADWTVLGLDSDEEDEDGDDYGDDESGRKRKKPKLSAEKKSKKEPAPKKERIPVPVSADGVLPEKRKRGRPRKVVQPLVPEPVILIAQEEEEEIVQASAPIYTYSPPQYLLATFALFSFFNNPLTSPSQSASGPQHTHSGAVLSHVQYTIPTVHTWISPDLIQSFHLLVSVLVLLTIVLPWLPKSLKRLFVPSFLSRTLSPSITVSPSNPVPETPSLRIASGYDRPALLHALSYAQRGAHDEAEGLRAALGFGFLNTNSLMLFESPSSSRGFEQRGLEQRACVRLGELVALNAKNTTMLRRFQTYWSISKRISWFGASACDLATLALVILPIIGMRLKAQGVWDRARLSAQKPCEKLVFEKSGSVENAARILTSSGDTETTPIAAVAAYIVRQRMRDHSAALFVKDVLGFEHPEHELDECLRTVEAARSLGGSLGDLGEMLECICGGRESDANIDSLFTQDEDMGALMVAIVLYRRILITRQKSVRKNDGVRLRHILASEVFDFVDSDGKKELRLQLEDARDAVVDILVG